MYVCTHMCMYVFCILLGLTISYSTHMIHTVYKNKHIYNIYSTYMCSIHFCIHWLNTYIIKCIRACLCTVIMTALVSFPFRMVVQGSMDGSPVPSASSPDGRSYIHTYIHTYMPACGPACVLLIIWAAVVGSIHLGIMNTERSLGCQPTLYQ